jgi:Ca2+ transporting ATPase
VLCAAAVVSLIIGIITEGIKSVSKKHFYGFKGWLDGVAIMVAVTIIVSVTAGNNFLKDKQFRKLNAQCESRDIDVVR